MKNVITTGKTIEEAILNAVAQLGVHRDKLDIEIIDEPVRGLFGLIGGKDAKIKAAVKETQSDKAKEFLNNLFQHMGVKTDISVTEKDDNIDIKLSGEKMGILIGYRGETLDSIQYLTSLVVNKKHDEYKRVIVDSENYRSKREDTLIRLGKRLAYKVQKTKRSIVLEPMNPYERRIIHSTLQNNNFVTTRSEGEEPFRKVVIYPK